MGVDAHFGARVMHTGRHGVSARHGKVLRLCRTTRRGDRSHSGRGGERPPSPKARYGIAASVLAHPRPSCLGRSRTINPCGKAVSSAALRRRNTRSSTSVSSGCPTNTPDAEVLIDPRPHSTALRFPRSATTPKMVTPNASIGKLQPASLTGQADAADQPHEVAEGCPGTCRSPGTGAPTYSSGDCRLMSGAGPSVPVGFPRYYHDRLPSRPALRDTRRWLDKQPVRTSRDRHTVSCHWPR